MRHSHVMMSRHSNTLKHTATPCNTHCNAHCSTLTHTCDMSGHSNAQQRTATHSNTQQRTATHCNTLQHTATHCNTLQRTATPLPHSTTHLQHTVLQTAHGPPRRNCSLTASPLFPLTHCNTLQHTATHLQHTCNTITRGRAPRRHDGNA